MAFVRRLLNIMVERQQNENEPFCYFVPMALREYADALDRDNSREQFKEMPSEVDTGCVRFKASNGCIIKVIAGTETITQ